MKEINRNIARNIKTYMEVLGITQLELAKMLGCSNTTVSMWTQGEATPRMDKIDKMCELFHCTRQDLISEAPKSQESIEDDQIRAMFLKRFDQLATNEKLRLINFMEALIKK